MKSHARCPGPGRAPCRPIGWGAPHIGVPCVNFDGWTKPQTACAAREAILDAHSAAETAHDLDAVIATFDRPRYEIVPTGEVFDGEAAVRRYHGQNHAGVPTSRVEPIAQHHGDEAWPKRPGSPALTLGRTFGRELLRRRR